MSQYFSQVNDTEGGFQVLVKATEMASKLEQGTQEDKRLKLSFLLSPITYCSNTEQKRIICPLSTFGSVVQTGGNDALGIPERNLKNRFPGYCSPVQEKQNMSTERELCMASYQKPLGAFKDNSSLESEVLKNGREAITIADPHFPSGSSHGLNGSFVNKKGEQKVLCFSELSSATSLLEGSTRRISSRRGRKRSIPTLSDEQRRKIRTLRNREAAERARIRKQERARLLEQQLNRILDENRRLEKELIWLKQVRASSCI